MTSIEEILKMSVEKNGSDLFIIPGAFLELKIDGNLEPLDNTRLKPESTKAAIEEIYKIAGRDMEPFIQNGDDDFSFSLSQTGRFRASCYRQRNSLAAVIRIVPFGLPSIEKMNIPKEVIELANEKNGMVLVTGATGSGKSTTLACMVDAINENKKEHIITLEDPIEFIHRHKNSLVSQREIRLDTKSYDSALKSALRQSPNTILVGEMRDAQTIQTALTAAETGQLMLSSLHTASASKTIERIVDVFPAKAQEQIRTQLSMVLKAVVSQQLIPGIDGKLYPAFEIMKVNPAIANMIRADKIHQIDNEISSRSMQGMRSMDQDILRIYKEGKISKEAAIQYAHDMQMMERRIR